MASLSLLQSLPSLHLHYPSSSSPSCQSSCTSCIITDNSSVIKFPAISYRRSFECALMGRIQRGLCNEGVGRPSLIVACRLHRATLNRRRQEDPYVKVSKIMEELNGDSPNVSRILETHGPPLELSDWFILLEEIGKQQRWLLTLEVFRLMQQQKWSHRLDAGFYAKLIAIMGKQHQLRLAVWLFSEMRRNGCRADTSVFNAVINAHLRNGKDVRAFEKALYYLDEMKRRASCQPNLVTYNIFTRACAKAGLFDKVDGFLNEITKAGMSPDLYTFNGIIDAYGKAGYIFQMELALKNMREQHIKPDVITFNILIDSYGKCKDFRKMEQVFKSMCNSREKPNIKTFNSMISNYGKAALIHNMESVVEKMVTLGFQPNIVTFEVLITSYGNCKQFSRMMEAYGRMHSAGIRPLHSTLNAILEVYCRHGLLTEADNWLRNARFKMGLQPDVSSYTILVKAFGKEGEFEKMNHLLERMKVFGLRANKKAFLDVLESYSRSESPSPNKNGQTVAVDVCD